MSNLRVIGSISRILMPATAAAAATSNVALKLMPIAVKRQLAQTRELHNRPKASNQQQTVVSSSVSQLQDQYIPQPVTESVFKLEDLKVFQDEQIIQLSFKSGTSVNYTMSWLRNLCSCSGCISNKFLAKPAHGSTKPLIEGPLSVARFSSNEDELVIEWLDVEYHTHVSKYNLKYLNLYANSRT